MITFYFLLADLQWKSGHMAESLTNMPRHSLYIIIGALCVAFVLMLIILIVGICRISRIEYQGSSRPAYEEFYNCRSIDSEFSSAIASIRHARFVLGLVMSQESVLMCHFSPCTAHTSAIGRVNGLLCWGNTSTGHCSHLKCDNTAQLLENRWRFSDFIWCNW